MARAPSLRPLGSADSDEEGHLITNFRKMCQLRFGAGFGAIVLGPVGDCFLRSLLVTEGLERREGWAEVLGTVPRGFAGCAQAGGAQGGWWRGCDTWVQVPTLCSEQAAPGPAFLVSGKQP